jgi:glucose dehydrogenase
MKWLTAKRQVKILYAVAALVTTCGAAMALRIPNSSNASRTPISGAPRRAILNQTRYSSLKDINTGNVKGLQMVWSQSSGTLRGHEGQPLVIEDVGGKPMMFIESGWPNIVQALDLSDPDHPCRCGTTPRPAAATNPRCRAPVATPSTAACRMPTANWCSAPWTATSSPWMRRPARKSGSSSMPIRTRRDHHAGADHRQRQGHHRLRRRRIRGPRPVTAYNLADGKKVWECHSTGSDKDVCLTKDTNKAHPEYGKAGKDLGINTYVGDEWKRGGGAAWGWYAYDPALHMVYYGTGNPGLWSPQFRCAEPLTQENCNSGKFDNKWSMSIFARNVDTGEASWVYQMTPFDQWDYDGINEVVLVDMNVDGKMRKTLVHFDRNGFAYVLDRTDGTLLRANKYVTTNWAEKIDMKTGRPVKVPSILR